MQCIFRGIIISVFLAVTGRTLTQSELSSFPSDGQTPTLSDVVPASQTTTTSDETTQSAQSESSPVPSDGQTPTLSDVTPLESVCQTTTTSDETTLSSPLDCDSPNTTLSDGALEDDTQTLRHKRRRFNLEDNLTTYFHPSATKRARIAPTKYK